MSSPNSIVVNCGATHASISVFSAAGSQLKLEKFLVQELSYNYADEDEWLGALTVTLKAMVRTMKLGGEATVIVPGYMLLTKNIKVPQVERSRQQQIIAFEAQNNLPYGLHEMVWGSQIIATDGVEAEVALFALKSDVATRFTEAFASTGLKPTVVQAATLMDCQAYRWAQQGADENVLLINVGARSTNLTFISSNDFSIQNISIGGNNLTQSISDNMGKPFQAAEQLKLTYFGGQNQNAAGDPLVETLQVNAQSFVRRLSQDITRRIVNYKRQSQGRAPTKILLTGRASLLPGLSEQLCESQRLSVEYFDPTAQLQLGSGVNPQYLDVFRFQMSEVIGAAARLVLKSPIGVNLLPGAIAESMAFAKKKPFFVAAALLLAIAPWPTGLLVQGWNVAVAQAEQKVKAEEERYRNYQKEIETAKEGTQTAFRRTTDLHFIFAARNDWREFLSHLQSSLIPLGETDVDGMATRHAWVERMSVARDPLPASKPGEWSPPKSPPTRVSVVVRALMPQIAPGANFDDDAVSNKFREIRQDLQKNPFVESVREGTTDFSQSNLPTQTFTLHINPQQTL